MPSHELPARYAPEIPFPPYAFISGRHPHPVSHPQGHRFGVIEEPLPAPDAAALGSNAHFRHGVDLFNHGYYWEAHEVWEGLWLACGRRGKLADFLKALIRLAAAGVKAREDNRDGVMKHARRTAELFTQTGHSRLAASAEELASDPITDSTYTIKGNPILPIQLTLEDVMLK